MTTTTLERHAPRLGGFSRTFLLLELRRMMRNRRTMIFTLLMPTTFFLLFGLDGSYKAESAGSGNVTAYIMISMAVYGAMIATTSGGAMVSGERAAGWSRRLRLTPLNPVVYIVIKLAVAMVMGAVAILVVCVVGSRSGAEIPALDLVACVLLGWLCSLVFAAFGLFMGYLLPSENVMQVLGPALAVMAFAGGLFVPLDAMGSTFATIAKFTPVYGTSVIARHPLVHECDLWAAVFATGAVWRLRRDTARV